VPLAVSWALCSLVPTWMKVVMTLGSFRDSLSRYLTMRSVSSTLVPTGMESFR